MQIPLKEEEWKQVASDFGQKWNFWNCLGALDGKHVNIIKPPNAGSRYFNYKGNHSVVLMAIVNANYEFLMVDVGTNGRVSDGGVIYNTKFWELLQNNKLNIPKPSQLPDTVTNFPYVFVGDDAFALGINLMKPYNREHATRAERIFNYRLSRARRVVENAFGILVTRFGIFQKPINLSPEKTSTITLACCYLHNFLIRKASKNYYTNILITENLATGQCEIGSERSKTELTPLQKGTFRNSPKDAKQVRDSYRNYFNMEGQVLWQNIIA